MREIVLDTETTGLDPKDGHRVVEIGCVELKNHVPTGRTWQTYLNPEREMPVEAAIVHGLKDEFLAKQPLFSEIVDKFLEFIGEDTPLVIHNAGFDMGFLNAELARIGFAPLPSSRAIDTVVMARRMFPGAPASLDALCKRFDVDTTGRELHGALLDARLLADVYLELRGGRQPDLVMSGPTVTAQSEETVARTREFLAPRAHGPTEDELRAHEDFLQQIKDPLWRRSG
jgi:DNA polymerase-3 subunit epsilon